MSWMKTAAWVVVAGAVGLSVALATQFGRDPNLVTSPLIGRPAPDLSLPRLEGTGEVGVLPSDGEIVVVNFFASWCIECRAEHPALTAVADRFGPSGVRFLEIAYEDEPQAANGFLDELGRSDAADYLADPGSRAAIAFGVFGVPETYFVDGTGTVVGKIQGQASALLLGQTLDTIRSGGDPGQHVVGDVQSSPGS